MKTVTAFISFLAISFGIWSIVDPESAFMFGKRWQFKHAEPSDDALLWTRIVGILAIVLVIVLWFRIWGVISF